MHLSDFLLIFQLGYLVICKILVLLYNTQLSKKRISLSPYGLLLLHVQLELVVLLDQGVYHWEACSLSGWLRHGHAQTSLSGGLDISVRV